MSVRSADSAASAGSADAGAVARKIHKRIACDTADFSASRHESGVRAMGALQALIEGGAALSRTAQLQLLCAGVALQRRVFVEDDAPQAALLGSSVTLLFALIVAAAAVRAPDGEAARAVLERAAARSLWDDLRELSDDEPDEAVASGDLARAAMQAGSAQLATASAEELAPLARTFFKASTDSFLSQQLTGGPDDFLTLGAARFAAAASRNDRDESIANIVAAAESELGQVVFRDLLMSFKLPVSVLGVRRVLVVTREAQQVATETFPEIVNQAHERAMEGANWCWNHNDDPLVRTCVLLAGVAMLTTIGGSDGIRKSDAFGGRVQLPFLETAPPPPHALRVALLPNAQSWTLYSHKGGKLDIRCVGTGEEGLLLCLLPLVDTL